MSDSSNEDRETETQMRRALGLNDRRLTIGHERPPSTPTGTSALTHTDRAGSLSILAIIEAADAVQTNGFGSALCSAR